METHFGYQKIAEEDKAKRVSHVFDSVATHYNLMNDLMSLGMHRLWKQFTLAVAKVHKHETILDVASGTGDLALLFADAIVKQGGQATQLTMTDINASMLKVAEQRLIDHGHIVQSQIADAEQLPFADNSFDLVTLAFGLRNMTHKDLALAEIRRVLKSGGRLLILEFSKIWQPLEQPYDFYSFHVIPRMGKWVTGDADSYQYLVESIRMHPNQVTLKTMMETIGLQHVEYWNLAMGAVALHRGYHV